MTAEDYLQNSLGISHFYHDKYEKMCCLSDEVQKAMIYFAKIKVKEALEIAAKKAKTKKTANSGSYLDASVDQDSILNAINLDRFIK